MAAWLDGNEGEAGASCGGTAPSGAGRGRRTTRYGVVEPERAPTSAAKESAAPAPSVSSASGADTTTTQPTP